MTLHPFPPLRIPPLLTAGDSVALIAPAGAVRPERIDGAVAALESRGYNVIEGTCLRSRVGSFSGTPGQRLEDLLTALRNSDIKAIFCARGGFGAIHLLEALTPVLAETLPRWLIGFSDISALHAAWLDAGIMPVHGPMARHLTDFPPDNPDLTQLFTLLEQGEWQLNFDTSSPLSVDITAPIYGGNLAVLDGLSNTRWDELARATASTPAPIIFLEDINEPLYKLDRMLTRLRMAGILPRISALLLGQFTGIEQHRAVTDLATERLQGTGIPVIDGLPVGHGTHNAPIPLGAPVRLRVNGHSASLELV